MAHNNLIVFGQRVRSLRQARGLSQEALAERIDVHRNFVGFIERGERNIGLLNLVKLAQVLNTTFQELMDDLPFER